MNYRCENYFPIIRGCCSARETTLIGLYVFCNLRFFWRFSKRETKTKTCTRSDRFATRSANIEKNYYIFKCTRSVHDVHVFIVDFVFFFLDGFCVANNSQWPSYGEWERGRCNVIKILETHSVAREPFAPVHTRPTASVNISCPTFLGSVGRWWNVGLSVCGKIMALTRCRVLRDPCPFCLICTVKNECSKTRNKVNVH